MKKEQILIGALLLVGGYLAYDKLIKKDAEPTPTPEPIVKLGQPSVETSTNNFDCEKFKESNPSLYAQTKRLFDTVRFATEIAKNEAICQKMRMHNTFGSSVGYR